LKNGIIRTPLEPYETFHDDPLRVLRCIRFANRFGFSIDKKAYDAMQDERIKEALRTKISRERVGVEVNKMITGK
jgi:tRNA nucleotidyltransferase (CCA-adding enzyme)